jgi:hypothetical protein
MRSDSTWSVMRLCSRERAEFVVLGFREVRCMQSPSGHTRSSKARALEQVGDVVAGEGDKQLVKRLEGVLDRPWPAVRCRPPWPAVRKSVALILQIANSSRWSNSE